MMQVLSVASECVPLVKTGGLADVVGALPAALHEHGIQVTTLLPGYPSVMTKVKKPKVLIQFDDLFGGSAQVLATKVAGLDLLILDAPHLYDRSGGIYLRDDGSDHPDNPSRFAALCFAAAHIAKNGAAGWMPDVVHGHDWQAGLVPEYMRDEHDGGPIRPFVLTIHNVAFHGNAAADYLDALKLDPQRFTPDGFEYWGQISALKAGLLGATKITTVSHTYAHELMTSQFGMGMEGVLRARRSDVVGIINGIDLAAWNPGADDAIRPFKTARGKAANKVVLQAEFGLAKADGPLCVLVSRLSQQKGIDIFIEALPALLDRGGQLALLGSGDATLEASLLELADQHPNFAVKIGYDEALSHLMVAGGDAILVPSRFEPCGLTQLYGLRYGTIPLVALTGGLADTVINANPAALSAGVATGIQFHPINAVALAQALDHLCDLYAAPKTWRLLQRNAMKQKVGWQTSAGAYAALYRSLVET